MEKSALDRDIRTLRENAKRWAEMPLGQKIGYLESALRGTVAVAERQVAAAVKAKGLDPNSPAAGEDWLGGPLVQARTIRLLIETLKQVAAGKGPKFKDGAIRTRPDGQVAVDVFPVTALDKALFGGFRAEIWMEPDVRPDQVADTMAVIYKPGHTIEPKVALVLGAGNVASIGPLDVVHKLYAEGQVCLLKWNPVNEYLGPFFEEAFADLIRDGFVRTAYGAADVGDYLCQHPEIDEIHITGSDRTHDAIVYGVGEEGARNKAANKPRTTKRITSELGNVSPVIVVPGPWTEADLKFHAENIATQMTNNAGFNCNAAKVLVLHDTWPQKRALLDAVRATLAALPQRRAYYPGAEDRWERFVAAHPQHEAIGGRGTGVVPWTLIPDVDATKSDDICFRQESFCGVTAQTALPGADAAEFLQNAVRFCNETLWGTLSASILVHPRTAEALGARLEDAIAQLRYGSVVINHWPALAYGFGSTTWGAWPGHTYDDIQSGIGVVHNAFLFERPQKSVIYGPFRVWPRPPWFVTNTQTHKIAPKLVKLELDQKWTHLPGVVLSAVRG
jgi:hypothetical protein